MSLFEIFRGLLRPPAGRERWGDGRSLDQEEEDEDEGGEEGSGGWGDPFGPEPFGRQFSGLFREMDEMFRGIGSWDIPIGQFEFPELGDRCGPGGGEHGEGTGSARDWMLKGPEAGGGGGGGGGGLGRADGGPRGEPRQGRWDLGPHHRTWNNPPRNFEDMWNTLQKDDATKQDQDLDSKVTADGLERALRPQAGPLGRSFFKSVSISTIVHRDGTVEERRTERDGRGNEETKLTRVQGDQSFTTVTRRGADGSEEETRQPGDQDHGSARMFAERRDLGEGSDVPGQSPASRNSRSLLDWVLEGLFRSR